MQPQLATASSPEAPELSGLATVQVRGFSVEENCNEKPTDNIASAFKAIGHPVRIRIMDLLSRQPEPMCVCHIESRFTLSQPTISHHLRLLRKAGLVNSERRGTWIYYSVRKEGVGPLNSFVTSIICKLGENTRVTTI